MKKILTVGEILVEIVATTKGEGFLEAQSLIGPFPSGAPAIFIDQIGRLGGAGGIISRVGNDDFGALNIRRLQADGIDVSAVEIAEGEATGSAFVRYREDGSRKFVFNIVHSAYGGLQMTAAAEALIADCEHLHIMGTALAAPQSRAIALHALQAVKSRGGSISFDPNIRAEMMGDAAFKQDLFAVLRQCDVFLPSGEELFLFTQAQEEAAAVAELLAQGVFQLARTYRNDGDNRARNRSDRRRRLLRRGIYPLLDGKSIAAYRAAFCQCRRRLCRHAIRTDGRLYTSHGFRTFYRRT